MHATRTTAVPRRDGTWAVSGTKTWISRLDEAAVFCVFFKDPAGRLTVGVVNADAAGLCRRPVTQAGLSGWTWGELHLDGVRLRRRNILARPGKGMDLLREHFAHYRPLVAAVSELTLLVGAPGFTADWPLAKARRDLNGLLYADGIHDSLYRAVGRALITSPAGAFRPMRALHREG